MSTPLARDSRGPDPAARGTDLPSRPAPVPAPADPPPAGAGRVVANLFLLSIVGVAASIWIWHYTEWFPVMGGLLGMGGVFTWLAFLSGILTSERRDELQALLDRKVLAARWLIGALAFVTLAGAALAASCGAVIVRSTADDRDRTVAVTAAGPGAEAAEPTWHHLPPRSALKLPTWIGAGERELLVRVSGLPPQPIVLGRFDRRVLEVPGSFRPGIEVVVPEGPHAATVKRCRDCELVVLHQGNEAARQPYRGQRTWIGGAPEGTDTTAALVLATDDPLRPGDRLEVEVTRPASGVYLVGELVVPRLSAEPTVGIELKRAPGSSSS